MLVKALILLVLAVAAAACSSTPEEQAGFETPERAVVVWFDAIDGDDHEAASEAVHAESLALILGIENGLDSTTIAAYLDEGIPPAVQSAYWISFAEGFVEFASRPISTLTVGESTEFTVEAIEFASVPVRVGPGGESIVLTRQHEDGSWEVDLVASLGDGFATLLASGYELLPDDVSGDRVRLAFAETVVPSLWAAMADGSYGDGFTRTALALIDRIER